MLSYVAVIFLLATGVFSELHECRNKVAEDCEPPERYFKNFPESKEDMDLKCRHGIRFLRCIINSAKNCEDQDEEETQYLSQLIFYLETEVCNEDSHIYSTIVSNLQCLNHTLPTLRDACHGDTLQEKKKKINSILGPENTLGDDVEEEKLENCMYAMLSVACNTVVVEYSCGERVGEMFGELSVNIRPRFQSCPEEVKAMLPYAVQALKAVAEAEEEVENAIKRRKK